MGNPPGQAEGSSAEPKGHVRSWILNHDETWTFTVFYIGLALVLSMFISLFWLAAVVAIHAAMEWYRQRAESRSRVMSRVFWEIKLDVALILFAMVVSVYMDFFLGIAGLGQAARLGARAGARMGTRMAGWQRALRGALLSMDDAAQVVKALL